MREEFEDILRFWFERGVDGVRIDSRRPLVTKDPALADFDRADPTGAAPVRGPWTRCTRSTALAASRPTSYAGERASIGEVWLPDTERFARYSAPERDCTRRSTSTSWRCAWDADALRRIIDETLAAHAPVDAPATWVLSNHDVTRHVTRYGRRRHHASSHDLAHRRSSARQ